MATKTKKTATKTTNDFFAAIEGNELVDSYTTTAKGALTHTTTGSKVLDLFSRGAAMRSADEKQITKLVKEALQENVALTLATIFYIRDVLKGQGERRFFKVAIATIAKSAPKAMKAVLQYIPEYGRWDDVFALEGTKFYNDALYMMAKQLKQDGALLVEKGKEAHISLAGKWCPSENASNKDTIRHAKQLIEVLGISPRRYRKLRVALRNHIRIVETLMCTKQWSDINYSQVPSKANLKYRKAFKRNDGERYQSYLNELKKPVAERNPSVKMNTATLTPVDIVSKILDKHERDETLQVAWDNLPDYLNGEEYSAVVVPDTSGSMFGGSPSFVSVAVALALYIAQRNQGIWNGKFINFSIDAEVQTLKGKNIVDIVNNLAKTKWGMTTNLQSVFDLILNSAVKAKLPADKMPRTLIIVSDMQFDTCCHSNRSTNLQQITKRYTDAGYTRPNLIFWHVNASTTQESPAKFNENGVALVSGCNPNLFQQVIKSNFNPASLMLEVITSERYQPIIQAVEALA